MRHLLPYFSVTYRRSLDGSSTKDREHRWRMELFVEVVIIVVAEDTHQQRAIATFTSAHEAA